MRISELSRTTHVSVETIRYYEKKGLLAAPCRTSNGYRAYTSVHLEQLSFIRHCRMLDIALVEIKRLLDIEESNVKKDCDYINQLIDKHLVRVRERLNSMYELEKQLSVLRACCEKEHIVSGKCGILRELVSAFRGEACACHST